MSNFRSQPTFASRFPLPEIPKYRLLDLLADCELQSGNSRRAEILASRAEAMRMTGGDRQHQRLTREAL